MNLDFYQKKAAYNKYPYSLIIAGAGTGKTNTLLFRISFLIQEVGLLPQEILVISYTKETVLDFQEKIKERLGVSIPVFTFHKLAMNILEKASLAYELCLDKDFEVIFEEFWLGLVDNNKKLQKLVCKVLHTFSWKYSNIKKSLAFLELKKNLKQFLFIMRAKSYQVTDLIFLISHSHGSSKAFLKLAYILWNLYISEKESQSLLDFDDLIEEAIRIIHFLPSFSYRHILIDEFQDSSLSRILLLKELVEHFKMHFTVVGDDYQSIYRFSGTETNCFSLLQDFFPKVKTFYLKYTYRNSQELIYIANSFVMKNPYQTKKEMFSKKECSHPIVVCYYKNAQHILKLLTTLVNDGKQILFLGRHSFDWKYYFLEKQIFWKDKKTFILKDFPDYNFTFLTVHQAKGLEADCVILLHLANELYGFPNQVLYPIYFPTIFQKDQFLYEEERRLFYVALTRTREIIYLMTPLFYPSCFVKELIKDYKDFIQIRYY